MAALTSLQGNDFIFQQIESLHQIANVFITDHNGKIIYVSDTFCSLSGYSKAELLGSTPNLLDSHFHPREFFKGLWMTISSGRIWSGQIQNRSKNNGNYWVSANIVPIKNAKGEIIQFLTIQFDITKEKIIELETNRGKLISLNSSRLSALSDMAGGIGHEINNPLTIILQRVEKMKRLLVDQHSGENELLEILNGIDQSARRISKVIKALGSFAESTDRTSRSPVLVKDLVNETLLLCSEQIRIQGIQLELDLDSLTINIQKKQIEQVLLNLITNAIYAVALLPEKWIKIASLIRGDFVEISVTDSGSGIDPSIRNRIMEPFFTTKEVGKGSGLGLSISTGIIDRQGGKLYLDTSHSNTRFVIILPVNNEGVLLPVDFDQAISVHLEWRQRLLAHLTLKNKDLDPVQIGKDNLCSLGKWIESSRVLFGGEEDFENLVLEHRKFHLCAEDIVRRVNSGESLSSELVLGGGSEFDRLSSGMCLLLNRLRTHIQSHRN